MKILVVEDEPQLAQTIQQFIQSEGHNCEIAGDLASALDLADSLFDIIILDLNLPDGNGLEVVKKVKGMNMGGDKNGVMGYSFIC